ncbi:MAG: hypothetical protein MPJ24_04365 [Pirellulaceae bacterium]|nr:hypothetical protein [Pirellulaceae bacterium]
MKQYLCDCCHKTIAPGNELRFRLNIRSEAVLDTPGLEESLTSKNDPWLEDELNDEIEREPFEDSFSKEYDLCSQCHADFWADPLRGWSTLEEYINEKKACDLSDHSGGDQKEGLVSSENLKKESEELPSSCELFEKEEGFKVLSFHWQQDKVSPPKLFSIGPFDKLVEKLKKGPGSGKNNGPPRRYF